MRIQTFASGSAKDKDCSCKALVRQIPSTIENVLETRIAGVGNAKFHTSWELKNIASNRLDEELGECVFEIEYDNHGNSMNLALDQWD